MKKQYRSSIIKRKYRCRKEDMDHVIRKSKEMKKCLWKKQKNIWKKKVMQIT